MRQVGTTVYWRANNESGPWARVRAKLDFGLPPDCVEKSRVRIAL